MSNSSLPTCPLREEKSFSQRVFSIYTDIRKLQDKAKTSYTLSTRRLRFGYESPPVRRCTDFRFSGFFGTRRISFFFLPAFFAKNGGQEPGIGQYRVRLYEFSMTFDDGSFPRKTQDALDLTGLPLTAAWSTGETTEVSVKDVSVSGYNKGTARGHQARKPPTPPV